MTVEPPSTQVSSWGTDSCVMRTSCSALPRIPRLVGLLGLLGLLGASGCRRPGPVVWQAEAAAGSQAAPLVTAQFIAWGHDAGVTLLELDGRQRCRFEGHGGVVGTPQSDGQRILFGSINQNFYAIDGHCRLLWQIATGGPILGAAQVANGRVYFGSGDGHLYAVDLATGSPVWQFPALAPASQLAAAPRARQGRQQTSGRAARRRPPPPARSPWLAGPPPPSGPPPASFAQTSPVLSEGRLLAGGADGYLYVLAADDGRLLWRFAAGEGLVGAPVVAGDIFYAATRGGDIYAMQADSHELLWRYATRAPLRSGPRLDREVLWVASDDHHVYELDARLGTAKSSTSLPASLGPRPGLHRGQLLLGADDGVLYGLRRGAAPEPIWRSAAAIWAEPLVVGERLYVSTSFGQLYALALD